MFRLLFGQPLRSIREGRELLGPRPAWGAALAGVLLVTVVLGMLHLHGAALVLARMVLVIPLVLVVARMLGVLDELRYLVRQTRSVLASPRPWQPGRPLSFRLLTELLCIVLRVPRRPWPTEMEEGPAHE